MRADTEKEILLLDSTLGIGGKLINWSYGEAVIPNIRRLSVKSGLDIVEYGLLRKYPLGSNCAAYRYCLPDLSESKANPMRYCWTWTIGRMFLTSRKRANIRRIL